MIVPSYTFFASVAPILQCGARPVFCEIDPRTLTADPESVAQRITSRTRAICVVHVWGNPAAMDRLRKIAQDANVGLVEDCSHAHGATFNGLSVGALGHIGCFSMQGAKAVSGGEAGVAVTNDATLYDRMLALGHYGRPAVDQQDSTLDIGSYSLGLKYRPHLYAIILAQESLKRLPELNRRRRRNLEILCEELGNCPAMRPIECLDGRSEAAFFRFYSGTTQHLRADGMSAPFAMLFGPRGHHSTWTAMSRFMRNHHSMVAICRALVCLSTWTGTKHKNCR